jgi:hypothetical protein
LKWGSLFDFGENTFGRLSGMSMLEICDEIEEIPVCAYHELLLDVKASLLNLLGRNVVRDIR